MKVKCIDGNGRRYAVHALVSPREGLTYCERCGYQPPTIAEQLEQAYDLQLAETARVLHGANRSPGGMTEEQEASQGALVNSFLDLFGHDWPGD